MAAQPPACRDRRFGRRDRQPAWSRTPNLRRTMTLLLVITMIATIGCGEVEEPFVSPAPPDIDDVDLAPPAGMDGMATVFGCPIHTLVPHDSRETCGGRIVGQLFSGLVELDADSGEPRLLVADEIVSDDAQTWRISLSEGWTFHDGESVTASSFVDAWTFAANPANGMRNRDFYADIVGYEALVSGESDHLSGLQILDDMSIEVTLQRPFAPFLAKLSDAAFLPLPSIAYEDLDAFARAPVGNGRFELVTFDPDREVRLRRFDEWAGKDPAHLRDVIYLIYAGNAAAETAYLDVRAGALDVLEAIPAEYRFRVDDDFGSRVLRSPTSSFAFLGLPLHSETPLQHVQVRQALSLAIDRQQIIDDVLGGGMQPAGSLIPPVLEAHRPDACASCTFDPQRARELLADAGGWEGPMTVYHTAGAGMDAWTEAIAAYWREELGIAEIGFETMDLAAYVRVLEEGEVAGPFSLRWSLSYLSPEYAMSELYRTTGGANFFGYVNAAFDDALDEANAADPRDASRQYQAAEDIVLADLPVIPLWYASTTTVHAERVTDVTIDARGYLRVERLRIAQ